MHFHTFISSQHYCITSALLVHFQTRALNATSLHRPADVQRLTALRKQAAADVWLMRGNRGGPDPRACQAAIAAGAFWSPWVS